MTDERLTLLEKKLFGGDPYVWDGKTGLLGEFLITLKSQKETTDAMGIFVKSLQQIKVKNELGDDLDFVEMVKAMYENSRKKDNRWKTYGQVVVYVAASLAAINAFLGWIGK